MLLDAGADVARLCEGSPALHMAVSVGSIAHQQPFSAAAVQLLLQHGAVPYERCEHSAVLYASWQAVLSCPPRMVCSLRCELLLE